MSSDCFGEHFNTSGYGKRKYRLYKSKNHETDDYYLTVTIDKYGEGFEIDGSLRKWWFGQLSAVRDLDIDTFTECVNLIAKRLKVKKQIIWNSHITRIEIGGNIKLPRQYKCIIPAIISFPRIEKSTFKRSYTAFSASRYKVVIYDKLAEVMKGFKKKLIDAVSKNNFVMRIEIKLRTSQFSGIKQEINTFSKIKANWNELVDYWIRTYSKIGFNMLVNPKVIIRNGRNLTRREFKDFAVAKAVEFIQMPFFEQVIMENFESTKRSQEKRHLRELCQKYFDNSHTLMLDTVKNAVLEKGKKMLSSNYFH